MLWTFIIAVLIILDQITKAAVRNNLPLNQQNEVIQGFFHITHVENTGAAFGVLKNGRYFFIILTMVVLIVLFIVLFKNKSKMLRLSLSLIIAGALGNWIDRVFRGPVTDFLDFNIFTYAYPVFNAADIFINIGAGLMIIYILFVYKEQKPSEDEKVQNSAEAGDNGNGK